jgi:hypothetical protein
MHIQPLLDFIHARHSIYLKKKEGLPAPWTDDLILQKHRFTNIYRELDTTTQWIAENWREPYKHDPNIWFAMLVARLINLPASLAELQLSVIINNGVDWNPSLFVYVLENLQKEGKKIFGGAYKISACGYESTGMKKAEYLAEYVLNPIWAAREQIAPTDQDSLKSFYKRLLLCKGMGKLATGQAIADIRYTPPLDNAVDWWTWAVSSVKSKQGLNRVYGRPIDTKIKEPAWLEHMQYLMETLNQATDRSYKMHMQDLQHCLMAFDKYERLKSQ